jgi:hypothetical protein
MPQNRRTFIQTTTSATAGVLFSSLDSLASPYKSSIVNKNFELKIMGTNWGFHGNTDQFCGAAKKEGYDGIEIWWPREKKDQDELFAALKKHSLDVGFLCGAFQPEWKEHLEQFKNDITAAATNTIQNLYTLTVILDVIILVSIKTRRLSIIPQILQRQTWYYNLS